jgi:hypothetical protein
MKDPERATSWPYALDYVECSVDRVYLPLLQNRSIIIRLEGCRSEAFKKSCSCMTLVTRTATGAGGHLPGGHRWPPISLSNDDVAGATRL